MELTTVEKNRVVNHPSIQILKSLKSEFLNNDIIFVGGGLIDLLEGREPKDIDIFLKHNRNIYHEKLIKFGFKYISDSSTAKTFSFGGYVFQLLKKSITEFDFKISKSTYSISHDSWDIDLISFRDKTLIPDFLASPGMILNSLSRIPHWRKKGYTISDVAYQSLLNKLSGKIIIKS
jgi:hypothetical protein